jgi:hypothetical protein
LIASYRCRPLRLLSLVGILLLGGLAVAAPLLYGYYRAQYALQYYGPVAAQVWTRPWWLLAGLAFVAALALLLLRLFEHRKRVEVHANGLVVALSRRQFLPWDNLSGIASGVTQTRFLGLPLSTRYQATLYPGMGKPLRLRRTVENLPELLTQSKAALYPRLLSRLEEAFSDGRELYFGSLRVDREELQITDRKPVQPPIPWEKVRCIAVQSGWLVVETEPGESTRLPVAEIPNLELMLQIIQSGVKR